MRGCVQPSRSRHARNRAADRREGTHGVTKSKDFAVQHKRIADLTQDAHNANRGTVRGAKAIAASLKDYGAGRSILLDRNGVIIAGNKTAENAGAAGMEDVLVVQTDGTRLVAVQRMDLDLTTDSRAKALAIADNRAGQLSLDWDPAVLKSFGSDLDLSKFWTQSEIDKLLPPNREILGNEDDIPLLKAKPKTKMGDIYTLEGHRLLCGDSTRSEDIELLANGLEMNVTLTDPPYGLGDASSLKNKFDVYVDSKQNLIPLIEGFLPLALQRTKAVVLTPGIRNARLYPDPTWMMAWFTGSGTGITPWGFSCWHILLCYGKDPKLAKGKGSYPDAIVDNQSSEKVDHPCSKPVRVWQWFVERITEPREIVFDPFGGSGTGIIACEKAGRRCFSIELSPGYCDVIVDRWQNATGKKAVNHGAA